MLKLGFNSIGDGGADAIGQLIDATQTMRAVDLESNDVSDEGAAAHALPMMGMASS